MLIKDTGSIHLGGQPAKSDSSHTAVFCSTPYLEVSDAFIPSLSLLVLCHTEFIYCQIKLFHFIILKLNTFSLFISKFNFACSQCVCVTCILLLLLDGDGVFLRALHVLNAYFTTGMHSFSP
jgi:hypothetical protein